MPSEAEPAGEGERRGGGDSPENLEGRHRPRRQFHVEQRSRRITTGPVGRKCQRKDCSEIVTHMFMIQTESEENRTWNPGNELNGDPV